MAEPSRLIFLTALQSDGSKILFDGAPMLPGIHLRSAFLPEMGFPSGGFHIERRFYPSGIEFPWAADQGWETLTIVQSPHQLRAPPPRRFDDVILDRLRTGLGSAFAEYYRGDVWNVLGLVQTLHRQQSQQEATIESPGRSRTQVRILDLLLLASLDPNIARLLSLYYIDGSVLPGTPVDYRVMGLWARPEWPNLKLGFNKLSPDSVNAGAFQLEQITFFTSLKARLERDSENRASLRLSGGPPPTTSTSSTRALSIAGAAPRTCRRT